MALEMTGQYTGEGIFSPATLPPEAFSVVKVEGETITLSTKKLFSNTHSGAAAVRTFTFPAGTFMSAPVVTVTPMSATTTDRLSATVFNVTLTGFDYVVSDVAGTETGDDVNIVAIG